MEASPLSPSSLFVFPPPASSYGALSLIEFEGFRQFGYLGGLGMVVAWGSSYLLLPPLLRWLDRGALPPRPSEGALLSPLASFVGRRAPRLAGALPVSADIIALMRKDGPRVTLAAFAGSVLVVLALFRLRAATALVIGSLLVGVLWMVGAMVALNIKLNFSNFIAFPITFGIGVEYAVNVLNRREVDGGRDILAALRSTGAAVALCSATTVVGYSSLLVAENQALFLFGLLAVLGEVTCIAAALVALPALLSLRRGPAADRSAAPAG